MSALFRKVVEGRASSNRRSKASPWFSGVFLGLFGLPFLLGGLFAAGAYFNGYRQWLAARSWVETPCRILSAELESRQGEDSTTYRATARYSYVFSGQPHEGERVGLGDGGDNIGKFQHQAHRELSAYVAPERGKNAERGDDPADGGRMFRCYVNPANPEQAVLYRDLRWEMQAFMAAFALLFPAVGAGVSVGGWLSLLETRRRTRLEAAHPDRPWRWRPRWGETTIETSTGRWRWGLYAFTLWGALVVWPLIAAVLACGALARGGAAWLVLIYPLVWCVPLALSLRGIRRQLATGRARLDLERLPVAPGSWLTGAVVLGKRVRLTTGAVATLSCQHSISTQSGGEHSSRTETEWSHDETIDSTAVAGDLVGTRIPLRIAVPRNLPPTGTQPDDPNSEIQWSLRLKVPGAPVDLSFEIPVFHDPNAPAAPPMEIAATDSGHSRLDLSVALEAERLVAEFDPQGRPLIIRSPLRRRLSLILFLLLFNLIWTGAAWFLIQQHAPLLFRIVWPVSAGIIWLILLRLLFFRSTLAVSDEGVALLKRFGPVAWRVDLPWDRISGFMADSNMQENGRDIWRVRAETVLGAKTTLLGGIRRRDTAQALAEALKRWRAG